jgi:O-methyltransferase
MASVQNLPHEATQPEALYLELLKKCLTRSLFGERYRAVEARRGTWTSAAHRALRRLLATRRLELVRRGPADGGLRAEGRDWPAEAETMIGLRRLDNLERCIVDVLHRGVPGDLMETGVWRGGATIFMRAVLAAYGDSERTVWAADSFQGVPQPDPGAYPADEGDELWSWPELAVPLEQVQAAFARYGLLDEQVRFLPGWFRDTLPDAPVDRLALLRLDGDLYESTLVALRSLYSKVSVGGYVVVDDYGAVSACRAAVEDFRAEHGIGEELERVDWTCVFWQRLH